MERRAASRSAVYGQACVSCFKTKCKCVPRVDGNGCERCHRLKRQCNPAASALRRRNDKKKNWDSRIADLEGRLDQLVTLLQARTALDGHAPLQPLQTPNSGTAEQQEPLIITPISQDVSGEGTDSSSAHEDARASTPDDADVDDDTDDANAAGTTWWGMGSVSSTQNAPLASPPSASEASMPLDTASASLDMFRSRMLHHFPFVYLPAHVTAQQLQQDRPFLFRAILCVTSSSTNDKRIRALELKRVLCEMAFLEESSQQPQQQQTLDLLLGLLTYIAWGWDHLLSRRSLSRLMVVATLLVGEMRLDKPAAKHTQRISLLEPGSEDWHGSTAGSQTTTHGFLERQRATLGCFVLSSFVTAYFSQIDALRWTQQIEEGLAALSASAESSDRALALQVRLQLLATKAAQLREGNQMPGEPPVATLPAPALLCIKNLMGQLQDSRGSVSPAFEQHFVLLAQTYYTELCVIETIHLQDISSAIVAPTPTCGPTRLSCFWQAALAIRSCTSTFLTLSPSDFLGISFIQWAQLARCIAALSELSELNEPGWDLAALRALIDLPALLACVAEKLELAAADGGGRGPDDVFSQLASGLRVFLSAHNERVALAQHEAQLVQDASSYGQQVYFMNPRFWLDQFFVDLGE